MLGCLLWIVFFLWQPDIGYHKYPCWYCFGYMSGFGMFFSIFTSFKKLKKKIPWFLSWSPGCSRLNFSALSYYILLLSSSFIALWPEKILHVSEVCVLFCFSVSHVVSPEGASRTVEKLVCSGLVGCWVLQMATDSFGLWYNLIPLLLCWFSPLSYCLALWLECTRLLLYEKLSLFLGPWIFALQTSGSSGIESMY